MIAARFFLELENRSDLLEKLIGAILEAQQQVGRWPWSRRWVTVASVSLSACPVGEHWQRRSIIGGKRSLEEPTVDDPQIFFKGADAAVWQNKLPPNGSKGYWWLSPKSYNFSTGEMEQHPLRLDFSADRSGGDMILGPGDVRWIVRFVFAHPRREVEYQLQNLATS